MAVSSYGTNDDFRTMSYGLPHENVVRYAQQQWENVARFVTDSSFIQSAKELASRYYSDSAIAKARAILNTTGQILNDPNAIYAIKTVEDTQMATTVMQRWIMAMPELRELEREQSIYGFADTYNDWAPPSYAPNEHPDYLKVMSGIVVMNEDEDSEVDWVATEYYSSDWVEGDRELSGSEQFEILNTWDFIRNVLNSSNDDPTNPFGGER